MSKNNETLLNEQIRFKEVRCLGDEGQQYGLISSSEALKIAQSEGMDLVLIAPNANPPVCKVMDYNKFRYQQEKKQKEAKKKQRQIEIKEIKLSVKIAANDISYKVKHAREFLEDDKHVQFRVFLKGREVSSPQAGVDVLERVWALVEDVGVMSKEPKVEGRYVNMTVIPKPKK
ncbi:MAG: translation initiation factor IF-3 [Helicobacter sp.]|nr:translation initiation factor IF-3 [Helicobacter sp.]